jgi:hypothetical protein
MRQVISMASAALLTACGGNTITQPSGTAYALRDYQITFTADSACTSLPAHVQRRSYSGSNRWPDGNIGPHRLADALFASYAGYGLMNILSLVVRGDSAEAWFQDPPIIERVTPDSTLMIEGHAAGPISGTRIEMPVNGSFVFCPKTRGDSDAPECSVPAVSCRSTNHKLALTPR